MRANIIKQTPRGIVLDTGPDEPIKADDAFWLMLNQRLAKRPMVRLEHNNGQPIRRERGQGRER